MLPEYNIFKKKNKFSHYITDSIYNEIIIINNSSINDENNYFTNFLSENGDINKKRLLSVLINELLVNNTCVDEYFTNNELQYSITTTERLLGIFSYNGINLSKEDIINIIKFKSRENNEVQFYMRLINNTLEVILIDVYHLGIPSAKQRVKGNVRIDTNPMKQYEKHRKNRYCLSNIINQHQN